MRKVEDGAHQEVLPSSKELEANVQRVLAQMQLPKGARYEIVTGERAHELGRVYIHLHLDLDPKEPHSQIETLDGKDYLDVELGLLWLQVRDALRKIGVEMDSSDFDEFRAPERGIIFQDYLLSESLGRRL